MSITGRSDSITLRLDPEALTRLARDLLAVRGHTHIRITDGPGDGCRDLHSVASDGERCLTQCKFTEDASATLSSKLLGELPLGMIKLGYQQGLFVTTGVISPQAKREYLNDYRDVKMSLEFLDGASLTAEILDSVLLRAMWLHNRCIERLNYAIAMPVLSRALADDSPVDVWSELAKGQVGKLRSDEFGEVDWRLLSEQRHDANDFAPYRRPMTPIATEGLLAGLVCANVVIMGDAPLCSLPSLLPRIAERVVEVAAQVMADVPAIAFRFGRPALRTLSAGGENHRVPLEHDPFTLLRVSGVTTRERDWHLHEEGERWTAECDARVSEMDAVRIYNPPLDTAFSYEIESPTPDDQRGFRELLTRQLQREWRRSFFALGPAGALPSTADPAPHCYIEWHGQRLFMWLETVHIRGDFTAFRDSGQPVFDCPLPSTEAVARLIREHQLEVVRPDDARHMVAITHSDPFPDPTSVRFCTADVLEGLGTLPSPLDPNMRFFGSTTAWEVPLSPAPATAPNEVRERVQASLSGQGFRVQVHSLQHEDGFGYVIVDVDEPTKEPLSSTPERLRSFQALIEPALLGVNELLAQIDPRWRRATRSFWARWSGVTFLPNATTPRKPHVMGLREDGTWEVLA